jgi:ABC-type transport system involved in multi-copper enzyme maturation permease subunit
MNHIITIAKNTLKLEVRDKIWIALLAFGLGYIAIMLFLSDLVLKELPMVKAFALLGIYFFNAIIALFLGTTSFYRDVERKTVYFILAKPISRAQFLLGKFFGLCAVIFLTSVALAVAYLAIVALAGGGFDAMGLLAILMQFLEMALFLAFAIFVSTFSSSLLSIVYTSVIFFLGHVVSSLVDDARKIGISGIRYVFVNILYYIFPNLEKFNIRDFAVHSVSLPWASFGFAVAYATAYIILLLFAAIWIFEKKEI